jgi:hypothetical protein
MAVEIQPDTLNDMLKIRTTTPFLVQVGGTVGRPSLRLKDALLRLGKVLVGSMVGK